ncbi:MAG: substrate-binding domain-containing protein, partial [Lachnospiraceae bacterium]|nr:substrate-binding domain-containing protein [Lachnospiraceae bacterium]
MKKKITSVLLAATLTMGSLAGFGATASAEAEDLSGMKFGIIIRAAGNAYAEKEASGFQEVIEASGAECIVLSPEEATADDQIPLIQSLISQGVDAIAIASNDESAL